MLFIVCILVSFTNRGRCGCDRRVVGFTTTCQSVPITTKVVNFNPVHEVYSIQHYVIKFVSDLRQVVVGFLHQYNWNIVESGVKSHKP
jgi:hypothetical protein